MPVGAAGGRQAAARAPQLQSLLIRLIDDFLFVTPSLAAAQALVQRLLSGEALSASLICGFCCAHGPCCCWGGGSQYQPESLRSLTSARWLL